MMLKTEVQELKLLHQQLISESLHENECPKRLLLLKSQLFQLERQNQLIVLRANQRQETLQITYNELNRLLGNLASWIGKDGTSSKNIPVPRSEVAEVVKVMKGVMLSLNKSIETVDTVKHTMSLKNKFQADVQSPSTRIDYNLKHLNHLEHQLSELYHCLEEIKFSPLMQKQTIRHQSSVLKDITQSQPVEEVIINKNCNLSFPSNTLLLQDKMYNVKKQITSCCEDLTELSLLNPQQPSSRNKITKDIGLDQINTFVKKFTRKKEVLETVSLIYKISHHKADLLKHKCSAMEQEIVNSQNRLELHTKFVEDVLHGLVDMFNQFEKEVLKCYYLEPLIALVKAYHTLQNDQSNENMSNFFKCFEDNELNLEHSVKLLNNVGVTDDRDVSDLKKLFRGTLTKYASSLLHKRDKLDTELLEMNRENADRKERLKALLSEEEIVKNIKSFVDEERKNKL